MSNQTDAAASTRPPLTRGLLAEAGFRPPASLQVPPAARLRLPERAVQFGTGAFVRGFVEYFLDEANRRGCFGGRVVLVGSTGSGRDQVLNQQDGLYTLITRGVEGGRVHEELRVVGAVSRAVSARSQWAEVLALARRAELELVFSNTTEVGIVLDEADGPGLEPPRSFPGKLTRFLLERARHFGFDPARGVAVVPCELIEDNGARLRQIVLSLAERWGVEPEFRRWVEAAVPFCNTLVDRIVPGAPADEERARLEAMLGYRDELLTTCEVYRLFAIEADAAARERLRFAAADAGVVLTDDVRPYRERKVRLLNGTHTIMVPAALLAGFETVYEAVSDARMGRFVRRVMLEEIAPHLEAPGGAEFAREVLDRFANPFIRHALIDITLQGTMKLRVRVVPSILRFAERTGRAPESLAFGFAAHLALMRGELQAARRAAGQAVPADDQAERLGALWAGLDAADPAALEALVRTACSDVGLWGTDLAAVPGWVVAVRRHLERIVREGAAAALEAHLGAVPAAHPLA